MRRDGHRDPRAVESATACVDRAGIQRVAERLHDAAWPANHGEDQVSAAARAEASSVMAEGMMGIFREINPYVDDSYTPVYTSLPPEYGGDAGCIPRVANALRSILTRFPTGKSLKLFKGLSPASSLPCQK